MATGVTPNQQQAVNLDNIIPNTNNEAAQAKRKLIVIGIIAIFIIIIVAVVAATLDWDTVNGTDSSSSGYAGVTEIGYVDHVCGARYDCDRYYDTVPGEGFALTESFSCFYDLNDTNCAYLCLTETYDSWDMRYAYYLPYQEACYCQTYSQIYDYQWSYLCFNTTTTVIKYEIEDQRYIADGRPYFLRDIDVNTNANDGLIADIKQTNCDKYQYYQNDEWRDFITNQNTNYSDGNKYNEWIQKGLSEHASIATFSKFNLELMSIGAPLWLIQLANNAALDEIRHTQIAFDIANMFQNNNGHCLFPNTFPSHIVNIDVDWNKISLDVAIGGCFGETISALTMESTFDNIIDEYIHSISMDEVRHSALAWTTIKWMIDNKQDGMNMDVSDRKWWERQIKNRKYNAGSKQREIYNDIIAAIVDKLWLDVEHKEFYKIIQSELESRLNRVYNHCVM